jgi:hypothetical protein
MKGIKLYFQGFLWLVAFLIVTGFGDVNVYQGIVRSVTPTSIVIINKHNGQQSFRVNSETKTFVSGRVRPVTRIGLNSKVEVAANRNDVCLQIVVKESPK